MNDTVICYNTNEILSRQIPVSVYMVGRRVFHRYEPIRTLSGYVDPPIIRPANG